MSERAVLQRGPLTRRFESVGVIVLIWIPFGPYVNSTEL